MVKLVIMTEYHMWNSQGAIYIMSYESILQSYKPGPLKQCWAIVHSYVFYNTYKQIEVLQSKNQLPATCIFQLLHVNLLLTVVDVTLALLASHMN